jgi:membrane associated rhomboid family serine protease
MIFFIIFSLLYSIILLLIKPSPKSLKAKPLTFWENFYQIRASLFSGLAILFIFFVITRFSFTTVDENIFSLLCLTNNFTELSLVPTQAITHLFIHGSLIHLLSNVIGLGLTSVYERRVGWRRFLSVLAVGSLASVPSIFFYSEPVTVCGISGGVFGLGAAYFTDGAGLTTKEWMTSVLLFGMLASLLTLQGEFTTAVNALDMQVDHLGHAMGAVGAILYCRIKPSPGWTQDNSLKL